MWDKVLAAIRAAKQTLPSPPLQLPVCCGGAVVARLEPVTWADADDEAAVALLADWRRAAADAFPSQFPVTQAGTQRWLVKQLLETPDRVLFWVTTPDGRRLGHLGLFRYDPLEQQIEIDNVVRGVPGELPGVMTAALHTLLGWTFGTLGMTAVFLRVFSDNARALRLYERLGFCEVLRLPLARVEEGDVVRWVEVEGSYRRPVSRYFVTLGLPREDWQRAAGLSRAA
jgi:RimJ/RimL family protein N-acetyltransferase